MEGFAFRKVLENIAGMFAEALLILNVKGASLNL